MQFYYYRDRVGDLHLKSMRWARANVLHCSTSSSSFASSCCRNHRSDIFRPQLLSPPTTNSTTYHSHHHLRHHQRLWPDGICQIESRLLRWRPMNWYCLNRQINFETHLPCPSWSLSGCIWRRCRLWGASVIQPASQSVGLSICVCKDKANYFAQWKSICPRCCRQFAFSGPACFCSGCCWCLYPPSSLSLTLPIQMVCSRPVLLLLYMVNLNTPCFACHTLNTPNARPISCRFTLISHSEGY